MNLKNAPYQIQNPLGGGENANVYQAIERATGKKIALKLSKPNSERFIQQEGELTQKVAAQVPHVRRVVSLGQMPTGEFYVAYEFVEQTLTKLLKERRKENKPFTLNEAAELLMPIAQALDQIHHHFKIAHSDLKPDNILVGAEGSIRLADFGNATPFGSIAPQVTPFYMTPEQANNQPCQAASDIYGLALILYEMLTLSSPIPGDNPVAMSLKVLKQKPISIQDLRPDIPPHLAQNIMKGLAKEPSARPQQASALFAGFPPPQAKSATPKSIAYPTNKQKAQAVKKKARRSKKWPLLALLMILFLAILGGGGYLLVLVNQSSTSTPVATSEAITEAGGEASPDATQTELLSTVTVASEEEEPSQEEVPSQEEGNPSPTPIQRAKVTSTPRSTFTPSPVVTPTLPPAVTNTSENTGEATLFVEEAPITVEPTFTIINSIPSTTIVEPTFVEPTITEPTFVQPTFVEPTFAEPTFVEPTFVQPTFVQPTSVQPTFAPPTFVQPTVPPPTKAPTAIPTTVLPTRSPPTKTATQAPASYDLAPEPINPLEDESIKSEIVTFEWNWNGPRLAEGQQFLLQGFRDGEWLELTRTRYTKIDISMRSYGNFETNWEWYIVVIDQTGKEISPRSRSQFFYISLSSN